MQNSFDPVLSSCAGVPAKAAGRHDDFRLDDSRFGWEQEGKPRIPRFLPRSPRG
jgi:hypothetical protein